MTDADILLRALAYDRTGRLVAWTPEAVGHRLIESYRVFDRTPMQHGPRAFGTAWPGIVTTFEDLVDERTRERLLLAYEGDVDWKSYVEEFEPQTINDMARDRKEALARKADIKAPDAAAYSRAEEAFRWSALYLDALPLLADAIGVWAYCRGAKRSIREALKNRREFADRLAFEGRRYERGMARIVASRLGGPAMPRRLLTRQEVMPGRNFDRRKVRERRKAAAAAICDALTMARVVVRQADEELSGQFDRKNAADDGDED